MGLLSRREFLGGGVNYQQDGLVGGVRRSQLGLLILLENGTIFMLY